MKYPLDSKISQGVITIVAGYVIIGASWIFLSDTVLVKSLTDINDIRNAELIKGMLYVTVTAFLLFVIISRYAQALNNMYSELKEGQNRLSAVLVMSKQGFYELDISSREATVSPGYWLMLGYDQGMSRVTLEWWQESLHPDDRDNAINTLNRCMNGEISEYKIKYRLRAKTGEWKTILSAGMVVEYNIKGMPERMIGMHTDMDYLMSV